WLAGIHTILIPIHNRPHERPHDCNRYMAPRLHGTIHNHRCHNCYNSSRSIRTNLHNQKSERAKPTTTTSTTNATSTQQNRKLTTKQQPRHALTTVAIVCRLFGSARATFRLSSLSFAQVRIDMLP